VVLNSLTSVSGQRTYNYAIREFAALVLFGASSRFSDGATSWNRLRALAQRLVPRVARSGTALGCRPKPPVTAARRRPGSNS
jgi:hypothetical protein